MAGRPVTFEWREVDSGALSVVDVVVGHGRTVDLIVALQTNDDWPFGERLDVADGVAMESGRPILIIPNCRLSAVIASRVLVAWNGRREAAWAVFDALPMLQQADAVKVIRTSEGDEEAEMLATDICASLVRHGVKADKTAWVSAAVGAGPALIAEADAFDADLV